VHVIQASSHTPSGKGDAICATKGKVLKQNLIIFCYFDIKILRDNYFLYHGQLQLWNDVNFCWLAVCQKQTDLSQDLITTGHLPAHTSLIGRDQLEALGTNLIHICDHFDQHGLVDYQLGIWEEYILCGK
jgi:hypothetical protein